MTTRCYNIPDTTELNAVLTIIKSLIKCNITKIPDGMWDSEVTITAETRDFAAIEGILAPLM